VSELVAELAARKCANGYPKSCAEIAAWFLGLPRTWCLPCRAKVEIQQRARDRISIPDGIGERDAKPVILESPYAGDVATNGRYLQACIRDSIVRGEAPFASHLMYTEALDDGIEAERAAGIAAGFAWRTLYGVPTVVYEDAPVRLGYVIP